MRGSLTARQETLLRIRAAVERMPDAEFDYRIYSNDVPSACGCVVQAEIREGLRTLATGTLPYQERSGIHATGGEFMTFIHMSAAEATGAAGKREAVCRINVCLARTV